MPLIEGGPPEWIWERTSDPLQWEVVPSRSPEGHTVFELRVKGGLEIMRLQFFHRGRDQGDAGHARNGIAERDEGRAYAGEPERTAGPGTRNKPGNGNRGTRQRFLKSGAATGAEKEGSVSDPDRPTPHLSGWGVLSRQHPFTGTATAFKPTVPLRASGVLPGLSSAASYATSAPGSGPSSCRAASASQRADPSSRPSDRLAATSPRLIRSFRAKISASSSPSSIPAAYMRWPRMSRASEKARLRERPAPRLEAAGRPNGQAPRRSPDFFLPHEGADSQRTSRQGCHLRWTPCLQRMVFARRRKGPKQ